MQIHRPKSQHRRAGLAPLELVLSLPILLFTMGLMIIFGTAGAWKIRTQVNARQAVWRSLPPRTGANDPHPDGWPNDATMQTGGVQLPIVSEDPYQDFFVVRGPVVSDSSTGQGIPVEASLVDFTEGSMNGFASITRDYPLMREMPPGRFTLERDHQILDGDRFQYHTMGIWSNLARRALYLYPLQMDIIAPDMTSRYIETALLILNNPVRDGLLPLEGGDPEIFDLLGRRSPDFQPQINVRSEPSTIPALRGRSLRPGICESDPEVIRAQQIRNLIDRIENVPERMTGYYIASYEEVVANLEDEIEYRRENMLPPDPALGMQKAQLENKLRQLRAFQRRLN